MSTKILGLTVHAGQSSASLLEDGQCIAAAAEERFNRQKLSNDFPKRAIDFCLKKAGLSDISELDGIAISWNPANTMRHINSSGFTRWRRYDPEWLYIVPNHLFSITDPTAFSEEALKLEMGLDTSCPVYFVDHHSSHLGHAVFQSGFNQGAAAIVDEYGEYYSVTLAKFNGNQIDIIKQVEYPHSLGVFFAAITEFLGFRPNSDEWKIMGACAYGNPEPFMEKVEKILLWDDEEGSWLLDQRYVEHANMKRGGYINDRISRLLGIPKRDKDDELTQQHYDLAAAAQAVFEKRMFQLLSNLAKETGETNLVASGGCFMNSLANGKIVDQTPFERLFIPYAAADNGAAMGAALWVTHCIKNQERQIPEVPPNPYLGPEWSQEEISTIMEKFKIPFTTTENPERLAAELISRGYLIGWYQGAMEFGERALGNRSILADPRKAEMKDKINSAVKYREAFRPFAPSILLEKVSEYFEIPDGTVVPYMEQVYPIKKEQQDKIPAVVHNDGTGRLQTVDKRLNPKYYTLIQEFEAITGVPVVLNTSFNVQGEPIVCSPEDAIRTFFSCGLDVLIMGNCMIAKDVTVLQQFQLDSLQTLHVSSCT